MCFTNKHLRPCETKETDEDEALLLNIPLKKNKLLITFFFFLERNVRVCWFKLF